MSGILRIALAALSLAWIAQGQAWAQDGHWYRGESANFIVYGRGERDVRNAAQALEDLDATLRTLLHVEPGAAPNKLEIYLVSGIRGLREVAPSLGDNVAGFYSATTEYVAAFAIYTNSAFGLSRRQILFHEYAHHFMLHYAPQAYPQWYIEGWAEFVSNVEVRDRRAIIGGLSEERGYSLADNNLMPMSRFLAPERVERTTEAFWNLFYAQSWFAATYIANRPERAAGMVRYVDALGHGGDPIESFEPAFGISTNQFADELQAYRRGRVQLGAITLPPELAAVTVTRMPRSADDLLLPTARLKLDNVATDDEAELARQVERIAARFPGDAFAARAAARAALLVENFATARAQLEPVLTANENDVEARFLLGKSYLVEADTTDSAETSETATREARRQFARVFRTAPNDVPTLFRYAESYVTGYPMQEQQLNVLARAAELAPQVSTIRLMLATELMRAQEYDAATAALRPLMYAPHSQAMARRARVMAESARKHEQAPEWAEEDDSAEENDVAG